MIRTKKRQKSNDLEAAPLPSKYDFSFICQTLKKVQFVMPIKIAESNGNLNCNTYLQYIHSPKSHFLYQADAPLYRSVKDSIISFPHSYALCNMSCENRFVHFRSKMNSSTQYTTVIYPIFSVFIRRYFNVWYYRYHYLMFRFFFFPFHFNTCQILKTFSWT